MDNLGKDNFWNEMKEKYPHSVDVFCKWIDGYKAKVGWVKLFGPDVKSTTSHTNYRWAL